MKLCEIQIIAFSMTWAYLHVWMLFLVYNACVIFVYVRHFSL